MPSCVVDVLGFLGIDRRVRWHNCAAPGLLGRDGGGRGGHRVVRDAAQEVDHPALRVSQVGLAVDERAQRFLVAGLADTAADAAFVRSALVRVDRFADLAQRGTQLLFLLARAMTRAVGTASVPNTARMASTTSSSMSVKPRHRCSFALMARCSRGVGAGSAMPAGRPPTAGVLART